jgi:antitoxin component of MazEF toxin-antitoxin module
MTTYTVTLEEDEYGDLVLPIPQPILDELNWHFGTVLEMTLNSDGTISIKEKTT